MVLEDALTTDFIILTYQGVHRCEMIIEGKKINLRKLKKSDAESIQAHAKHRVIAKFTTVPHPYKLKDAT